MRHIYLHCCVDFRNKERFSKYFKEPRERVLQWKKEFANYYVSEVEDDLKYLGQYLRSHLQRIQSQNG
jgi:hypothetical protein